MEWTRSVEKLRREVAGLARKIGFTSYDASHLELVLPLKGKLNAHPPPSPLHRRERREGGGEGVI